MSILERVISLIAPHECVGCGAEGELLCYACAIALPRLPSRCYRCKALTDDFKTCKACLAQSKLQNVWAATSYDGIAKELIGRLKFGRARAAAQNVARQMASCLPDALSPVTIVYVPTAPSRVRKRGYDQAALIARELGLLLDQPTASLLIRVSDTRQLGQTRRMRQRQMRQAFEVVHQYVVQNTHVLLVDDVVTTGATLEAAAIALKAAGAKKVSAVVFAAA